MIHGNVKKISQNMELHVLDLKELCREKLDAHIIGICDGWVDSNIKVVKRRLLNFLSTKDIDKKRGAVAEFLVHLYLRENGFKQEFLFFNLEETSVKKGFDGYFSKSNQQFIVESKSGSAQSKSISHKSKLDEAYNDIRKAVSGVKSNNNNPWRNALNHASHISVKTDETVRVKLRKLADSFDLEVFNDISEFNIIPCSTIFLDSGWTDNFSHEIIAMGLNSFKKYNANHTILVCITKQSLQDLIEYLKD